MGYAALWLSANWFSLLQTVSIVSGLFFNAYALMMNSRIRKVDTLINITQQHRSIWLKYIDSPVLARIIDRNVSLAENPMTDAELTFINLVILHITTVLFGIKNGIFPKQGGLDVDLKDFFSMPLPHAAWIETKKFRDSEIVEYIESLIGSKIDDTSDLGY